MTQSLHHTANRILEEFDKLENLEVSDRWKEQIASKIDFAKAKEKKYKGGKYVALVILFVVINAWSFFQHTNFNDYQNMERNETLQNISEELLINSIALN
jgi:hypothetical protein